MVLDKMAPICADFKWSGIRLSNPIQNWEHLQINLFVTIQKTGCIPILPPLIEIREITET